MLQKKKLKADSLKNECSKIRHYVILMRVFNRIMSLDKIDSLFSKNISRKKDIEGIIMGMWKLWKPCTLSTFRSER